MAHRVQLKLPGGSFVDYSNFVFLADDISGSGQSVSGGGTSQSSQQATLVKTWELGLPPTCQFFVGGSLNDLASFVPPKAGTEVWIDSTTFPNFFTGFITNTPEVVPIGAADNVDSSLSAHALYGYVCACQGHEIILSLNRVGFLPPFTNMTVGAIIAALGERLVPSRFDWSGIVGFGSTIPTFQTTPDQRFSDIVAELLKNQATKLWFVRYVAHIAHYDEGVTTNEPSVFETDKLYNPHDLSIVPISSAIVNDVTGIGDTEAQAYAREYTVGDGITTAFSLKLPVYGTLGKPIVADDFTSGAFDSTIWASFGIQVNQSHDASTAFRFSNGKLNVLGGLGLGNTTLLLGLGVEIKGSLDIDAGEIQFAGTSDAIVGGLFTSQDLILANCKYGFRVTGGGGGGTSTVTDEIPEGTINGTNVNFFTSQVASGSFTMTVNGTSQTYLTDYTLSGNSITFITPPPLGAAILCSYIYVTGAGAGVSIQAIVNGTLVGDIVITKPSMTYSLHLKISTPATSTITPPWYSSGSPFGGGSISAPVTAGFLVDEFSQLAVRLPNRYNIHQITQTGVPAFLFVGEFSVNTANLAINYFQITTPIQGTLLTQLVSDDKSKLRVLGFVGQDDADATIAVSTEAETLTFFKETRPIVRQRNEIRYRSAGPAVARVVSNASIAAQAAAYGDSGIRSVLLSELSPLPATSQQLEWALQAYLDDNDTQQFQGAWVALVPPQGIGGPTGSPLGPPAFVPGAAMTEPIPGRFINVYCPNRTPEVVAGFFSELIKVVTITVAAESDDGTLEQFEIQMDYGLVVTREMSNLLPKFSKADPPSVAVLRQVSNVPPIDTTLIGTQFIEDAPSVSLVDRDTGNYYFDLGQDLLAGEQVEVRYSDASWGQAGGSNFIKRVASRTFSVARTARDQFLFVKIVSGGSAPYKPSRYPAFLRMQYPLVPPPPTADPPDTTTFTAPKIHFNLPPVTLDTFGILIQDQRTLCGGPVKLSSSGTDTRGMLVVGQDASGAYMEEKVYLNGGTAVTTTKTFNWILWVNSDFGTVRNEVPSPLPNGTTITFKLAKTPVAGSVVVYLDGTPGIVGVDYNIGGSVITFINPPPNGSQVLANYIYELVTNRTVLIRQAITSATLGLITPGALQWLANPILYRYEDLSFGGSNQDPALTFTYDNSASQTQHTFYCYFYNLLDELSTLGTQAAIVTNFPPPPIFDPNCLDVRTFGAKGDGIADDTVAIQAAINQAFANYQSNNTASGVTPSTTNVVARPVVLLNGWGASGHVGNYEQGVTNSLNGNTLTLDSGTTVGYSNPGNAVDSDDNSAATIVLQHTHAYAGCVWKFGALPASANKRTLHILSSITGSNTQRSAGIWYSLDNAVTWKVIYNVPNRSQLWDSIDLPANQVIANIHIEAFTDSHDDMSHSVNSINITEVVPGVPLPKPALKPQTVCIEPGVTCLVSGQLVDSCNGFHFGKSVACLLMKDGVTLNLGGTIVVKKEIPPLSVSALGPPPAVSTRNFSNQQSDEANALPDGSPPDSYSFFTEHYTLPSAPLLGSLLLLQMLWSSGAYGSVFDQALQPTIVVFRDNQGNTYYPVNDVSVPETDSGASPGIGKTNLQTFYAKNVAYAGGPFVIEVQYSHSPYGDGTTPFSGKWNGAEGVLNWINFVGADLVNPILTSEVFIGHNSPTSGQPTYTQAMSAGPMFVPNGPVMLVGFFASGTGGVATFSSPAGTVVPENDDANVASMCGIMANVPSGSYVMQASISILDNRYGDAQPDQFPAGHPEGADYYFQFDQNWSQLIAIRGPLTSVGHPTNGYFVFENENAYTFNAPSSEPSGGPFQVFATAVANGYPEGEPNTSIKITGGGKVVLNGAWFEQQGFNSFGPGFARFCNCDFSVIDNVEVIGPRNSALVWSHSRSVQISNMNIHDGVGELGFTTGFINNDDGVINLDMLRNSGLSGCKITNCAWEGIVDWACFQMTYTLNQVSGCLGGYLFVDFTQEFAWFFSDSVTHNSLFNLNNFNNNNLVASDGAPAPKGSYGMYFLGGEGNGKPSTGDSVHGNIATGNSIDFFASSLTQFGTLLNNIFINSFPNAVINGLGQAVNETPVGPVNGTNKIFTLAHTPANSGALNLHVNGVLQTDSLNYVLTGNTVTFVTAPPPGAALRADYSYH